MPETKTPLASALRTRLGEVLVEAGLIARAELNGLLNGHRAGSETSRLESVIVESGLATEEQVADALSRHLRCARADLATSAPGPDVTRLFPRWLAQRHLLVPVASSDSSLEIAMADPTDLIAVDDVRFASGVSKIVRRVATPSEIRDALDRFYSSEGASTGVLDWLETAGEGETVAGEHDGREDLASLQRSAQFAPIVQLVNGMLTEAVRARATDIHIEPRPDEVKIRYRVDGLLREAMTFPRRALPLVVSRIKIMCGLDIAERRRPQDGRSKILVDGREVDTRTSTIPTISGEKVVLRLLPKPDKGISLSSLGFEPDQLEVLEEFLQMPQGLVVFTGPTGAGKSSSMYAALERIHAPEKNTVTLEDPIEYQMVELNQVQIDVKSGITFTRGMRSILRQDPDVIMVGEIRDFETAEIVMQSALTGHLVLSSLHTNDAASAVTRLIDLGVEHFLIASALKLVVAQRLVRVVCANCAEPADLSGRDLSLLGLRAGDLADADPKRGAGCELCGYTGYRGRTGIYELLPITGQIRDLIAPDVSDSAIGRLAREAGHASLRQSGLRKVKAGITTLEEILRVTQAEGEGAATCPHCSREIDPSFVVCPYCETDLGGGVCYSCGKDVSADWSLCPYCRVYLSGRPSGKAERPRLLLVDQDPDHGDKARVLFGDPYEILYASSGQEGVRRAIAERPDLILLDLPMPDLTSADVTARLRESPTTRRIPVIALVPGPDDPEGVQGLHGVADYIVKPLDLDELLERVQATLVRPAHMART